MFFDSTKTDVQCLREQFYLNIYGRIEKEY
jgi:hypothetical protein